jgi:transposase
MARIEIFRGQARRRWSDDEKRQLVAETFMPGATVHAVAQRHGVNTSQLFTWRKRYRADLGMPAPEPARVPAFAAVEVVTVPGSLEELSEAEPRRDSVTPGGVIEIELPRGGRVRIGGKVEPAVVTAALRVLVRR